ncbi:SusC/RagA family TonB-linked outer membrane protein [Chitinophaga lutea]
MKLTFVLFLAFLMQVSASTSGQLVSIRVKDAPVKAIFKSIRKQTGLNVLVVDAARLQSAPRISIDVANTDVRRVLELALSGSGLGYELSGGSIVIRPEPTIITSAAAVPADTLITAVGRVLQEEGQPVAGATVRIKGSATGAATDAQGYFRLQVKPGSLLLVSFIGYASQEVRAAAGAPVTVRLQPSAESLKNVVVTGMVNRNSRTFSGATAVFTGEQLKTVSNVNVVQGLRTLDPSFLVMENNLKGSNPNMLPTIELRGQTSIGTDALRDQFSTDPNQPLFILDGFETTLRTIMDLDINRVASITILKDAASTALYGSRASNGVVVVETIRPKSGEMRVSYTSDWTVELPDLSSYNRMNAREKLEFERLSGVYVPDSRFDQEEDLYSYYMPLYSSRLQEVERGVNSYWLNEPLQTGVSQRHSLYASAGAGPVMFEAGGNYRHLKGAMIGSGREDWGARANLTYRTGRFNISNMVFINGYKSNESPYGAFSTWVNVNPYYRKLNSKQPWLESYRPRNSFDSVHVSNPYYNAGLNSFDRTSSTSITNNLQINYDLTGGLRLQGALQLTKTTTTADRFKSPLHTDFVETPLERRGTLDYSLTESFSYNANVTLTWFKVFGAHAITANARTEVQENRHEMNGFSAEGFPSASNGNPRFAFGYTENGAPASAASVQRRNSVLASVNYSYDQRYNADLTYRYDGSTSFGSNNPYSPYYSAGLSWNLDKESFFRDVAWINMLRLRGNIGITGNQNFNSYTSVSTYNYSSAFNVWGQGVYLSAKGNPDLRWQNTRQTSAGLDGGFFNGRLNLQVNWYRKFTDPLVIAVTLPSSSGLSSYPFNAGNLTVDGTEFNLRFSPVFRPGGLTWTIGLTGSRYTQTYDDLNDNLHGVNEKLRQANSLVRYRDGHSPDDLWAVPSLGIDPSTGREIFLKADGSQTTDFSYADQVVVGNARPTLQGVISSMLTYKGFSASLNFRYITGQDIFNSALYDRVENISYASILRNNQDRRALYDRWKQPGDQSQFKSISLTDYTPMSSRFVQTENTLSLEALNIGYQFRNAPWMRSLRLSDLRLNGYTNEIFRISTVKRERGIEYPYARSFSFSLTANFH